MSLSMSLKNRFREGLHVLGFCLVCAGNSEASYGFVGVIGIFYCSITPRCCFNLGLGEHLAF